MSFLSSSLVFLVLSLHIIQVIPIQLQLQEGEEFKENVVEDSQLNECISVQRSAELGVCFGKEVLNQLNKYNEADTFSLATGVSFVRDDKTPRDFASFLDKDPMDFRYYSFQDYSFLIVSSSTYC